MNRRQSPRRATSSTWPGLRRPRQPYSACRGVYTPGRPRGTVGSAQTRTPSPAVLSPPYSPASPIFRVRAASRATMMRTSVRLSVEKRGLTARKPRFQTAANTTARRRLRAAVRRRRDRPDRDLPGRGLELVQDGGLRLPRGESPLDPLRGVTPRGQTLRRVDPDAGSHAGEGLLSSAARFGSWREPGPGGLLLGRWPPCAAARSRTRRAIPPRTLVELCPP